MLSDWLGRYCISILVIVLVKISSPLGVLVYKLSQSGFENVTITGILCSSLSIFLSHCHYCFDTHCSWFISRYYYDFFGDL